MKVKTQTEYLDNPGVCPCCSSIDITGESVDIQGNFANQEVSCNVCDAVWEDTYTLTSYRVTELPTIEESRA